MNVDTELERLLEEFDSARRRLETRTDMINEALDELPHAESIKLENYLGYGRTLRVNDAVRAALSVAAREEILEMRAECENLRQQIILRRSALAALPSS